MTRSRVFVCGAALISGSLLSAATGPLSDTFTNWIDHPAIEYRSRPTTDPVAALDRKMHEGRIQLTYRGPSGYLRSVLDALNVPVESQMAVFVPDSVQARRINPGNPRTLFFNDSVVVGWVRGGFIELAAQDPQQGVVFYSLDQAWLGTPRFVRRNDCLTCHYSYSTVGIPGMLVRSVGQFAVDHRLPLAERWGGWYVTGNHGSIRHLGNTPPERLAQSASSNANLNWPSLDGKFDWSGYLLPQSDIVALMVFEHQMHMMNLLSRIGWEARVADYERTAATILRNSPDAQSRTTVPLEDAAKELTDYLFFIDEAPLSDKIEGSTAFSASFSARGPRDRRGRSLRQLDLQRRLLRYPCSYMIYSELFEALPRSAKAAVYQQMWHILSGQEKGARYARLSAEDRRAIIEILRDTKQDLPGYFQTGKP
jgi:hypothetical protein